MTATMTTTNTDNDVPDESTVAAPTAATDRSDPALLTVLDAWVDTHGRKPTRDEVMTATGTGTGRATRLLAELDRRHGWPTTTTARPGKRSGTGARSRRSGPANPTTPTGPDRTPATDTADPAPGGTDRVSMEPAQPVPALVPALVSAPVPVPVADRYAGRFVSWVAFVFGSVMSVAANVLHTWLPAAHEPVGWSPGIAPQIGAAVWPIGLLLSVEVLSRVRWQRGWGWYLARYVGAGTVALGSAVISYGHLRDVLIAWGYGHPGADVGPLVLDGLMVISGFALLAISRAAGTAPEGEVTR